MSIITLAQVKTYLGIADTTYDALINTYIPIIDSKVKIITNNNWNLQVLGDVTDTETGVNVRAYERENVYPYWQEADNINQKWAPDTIWQYIDVGMQVSGTGIPSGAYVIDVRRNRNYNYTVITMSDAATETASDTTITLGFPIGHLPLVAKGIWWLIENTTQQSLSTHVTSERIGTISVSYGDESIDGRYGMPAWFVKGLPSYMDAL